MPGNLDLRSQAKPSLDELFDELDAAPLERDALFAVFDRMKFFYPNAADEIRQRMQARLDLATDEVARAKREAVIAEAEAAHMTAWADRERAKGRPEAELTWGNCCAETGKPLNFTLADIDEPT
jgi:hypothetical protein